MDLHLNNKHVVITGGSKGIGLECAQVFLEEGARVTIVSRSIDNLINAVNSLPENSKVNIYKIDLSIKGSGMVMADDIESQFGPIDILVNSAGSAQKYSPYGLTDDNWHDAMQNKFFTYMHAMNGILPRMSDRNAGSIVNIVGFGGKVAVLSHLPGGSANSALMLSSAGLANAYAHKGIRINSVNPVAVYTDRLKQSLEVEAEMQGISIDEAKQKVIGKYPIGRIMDTSEVASVVAFLASDRSSYISGQSIIVDGASTPII